MAHQGFTAEVYGETTSMGPLGGNRESFLPDELHGKWTSFGEFLDYLEELDEMKEIARHAMRSKTRFTTQWGWSTCS